MNLRPKRRRSPMVPISAMSDIGFLLLIFIMLVSMINYREEVKIEYPEVATAQKSLGTDRLEIWVDAKGSLFLDGNAETLQGIQGVIIDGIHDRPDTTIQVIADRRTEYRHIAAILDILQLAGHRNVGFVVKDQAQP